MTWIGVGYRSCLSNWLEEKPRQVRCVEVTAEHFFGQDEGPLHRLSARYPLFVHGLGLSLGTPGPLDKETLRQFVHVAQVADAQWVSEHVAFTRTTEVDLGHLTPIAMNQQSLDVLTDHALELAECCQKPLILENITSSIRLGGEFSEPEFLNLVCQNARCGLLLDVTNLFINSRNHHFDPLAWLNEIDPRFIVQLHVVGYTRHDGRYHDRHAAVIQPDLMELVQAVVEYAPVKAITLERDDRLGETAEIADELTRLEQILATS